MTGGGDPVGLPGVAALLIGFVAFASALIVTRWRAGAEGHARASRSRRSMAGIAVQGAAFPLVGMGPQLVTLDPLGTSALAEAALVALLMAGAVMLFVVAARAMGRNWSLVARTREDHRLVQEGPFARVRHPIYVALFLILLATALGLGHGARLIVAMPVFALGTWLRVSEEERLLRAMFAAGYDDYARRVARFVPGLF